MKLEILSLWTPNYEPLGSLAEKSITRYEMSRYDVSSRRKLLPAFPYSRDICWAKVPFIIEALENNAYRPDWFMWMDADCIILDPKFDWKRIVLTQPGRGCDLFFSSDHAGLCSGVFFFRNCEECLNLFRALWTLGPVNPYIVQRHPCVEQTNSRPFSVGSGRKCEQNTLKAFFHLFDDAPYYEQVPEDIICNPDSVLQPTGHPFIRHYWANARSVDIVRVEMESDLGRVEA